VDLTSKPPSRGTWSERWDPAWNGRNNFKKFRRADKTVSLGIGRQMIKLVDYKGKSAVSQGNLPYICWHVSDLRILFCGAGMAKWE